LDHFLEVHSHSPKDNEHSTVNKRIIESLIKSGAFTGLHPKENRADLWNSYLLAMGQEKEHQDFSDIINAEREYAGFLFSQVFLTDPKWLKSNNLMRLESVTRVQGKHRCCGAVVQVTEKTAKNGKRFHVVTLTDFQTDVRFTAWPESKVDQFGLSKNDVVIIQYALNDKGYVNIIRIEQHKTDMLGNKNETKKAAE